MTNDLQPRVLLVDIEATNLKADFGFIICLSYKWSGEKKVHNISIRNNPKFKKDRTNDSYIIDQFRKIAEQADIVVTHYGSIFDYPYLQTRALMNGQPLLPQIPYIDTWRIARKKMALGSNRLASLARALGVEEKTPLSGPIWVKAMSGDEKSISYIEKHCDQDVIVLEQVYEKIKGLRSDIPRLSHTGCPTCGSFNTVSRGKVRTVKANKQQYSCKNCGHWWSTPCNTKT